MCRKCGHIGQLWQCWWIVFCRACLCSQYTNLTLQPNQRNSRRPFPPSLESTHL